MVLTIKKQAAKKRALYLGSMSIGKDTPKVSLSVKSSRISPPHFFEMIPMRDFGFDCPAIKMGKSTSPQTQLHVQKGPFTSNSGASGRVAS